MLIRGFWQNLHNRSSIICEWYYRKSRPGRICFWENWNSEKNVVQNPSKTPEMHNTSRQLHKLNYTIKTHEFQCLKLVGFLNAELRILPDFSALYSL